MGEIRKRGRVYWIRYYRAGKRHEESSRSTTKGDAIKLLRLREGDIARGVPVSAKVGRLTFDEAAADVVTDYKVNGRKSLAFVERRIVLHLEPFFGGRRMASITPSDVSGYAAMRQEEGAKNGTINREIAIISRAFRLAEQSGNLLHHIRIPMLREDNTRTGFFERDQFEDVRQHLSAPLQSVVTFLYCTGWRIGEALPLQWPEVHDGYIHLLPGKTKNDEARKFPYMGLPELADVLETQRREHDRLQSNGVICPFVFHRTPMRSPQSPRGDGWCWYCCFW